ncbi:MAG: DUF177 domain-containing protein [Clostridia bacterium]|jgi:uncharacterized protein|nr:DUF177 domain-containing protein [Clostridia bacterium]
MLIDLESLLQGGCERMALDESFDFSKEELDGVFPFTTPVRVRGDIVNRAGIVTMRAAADGVMQFICDRCAGTAERQLHVPMEHILVSELQSDDDADRYILVPDGKLDLSQLALEDVFLSLPSKLLCQDDCQGICPQCGKNLNEGPCDCKKEIDPRLAALLDLLDS